eukprot:10196426-Alexandrium_andersonii.AAC.1
MAPSVHTPTVHESVTHCSNTRLHKTVCPYGLRKGRGRSLHCQHAGSNTEKQMSPKRDGAAESVSALHEGEQGVEAKAAAVVALHAGGRVMLDALRLQPALRASPALRWANSKRGRGPA